MNNHRLYQYFFRGLITFLPLALTVYVLVLFVTWTESLAMMLIRPIVGDFYLPGLGIALGAVLILALGALVSQPATGRLLSLVELPFTNLPVVKSIYSSLKNFADYFAPHTDTPAQQVVLLRMPGNEMGIVGLVTRQSMDGLPDGLAELSDQIAVYLPMGYMIGGYTVFVPRAWVTPVHMSVEEAMRMALIAYMASNRNDPDAGKAAPAPFPPTDRRTPGG
ncbi:DUF502 domain-containing protein [Methyloversatilis thermotolerans]|uniref:DUF502 domain-containing protein n=1 Tax=Methyloversatilis thermotolerans TaxID=1346290 RepID=UPI0003654CEF|nr:DUF502 domain-containing protein [Methyloversatilis thermotolerans]